MVSNKDYTPEDFEKLTEALERAKSQFYIFYELTQVMRSTLRLDEIAYIILTCLTARQGLGFNRAMLFLVNSDQKTIDGFMGIGPVDSEDTNNIWNLIETQKMDLYALIDTYNRVRDGKIQTRIMQLIKSLHFPCHESSGLIYEALHEVNSLSIKSDNEKYKNDILVQKLKLKDFIVAPLWSKNKPLGLIILDNYVTLQSVTEEEIRILNMFINQAAGAIQNSKTYEDTLIRAHSDTLTSLWNYGYFCYKLDEEIIKAKSKKNTLSVLMIDIDDFKKFNDSFGHQAGDQALKKVSAALKKCSRKIDLVSRYGGEEFAMILPNTSKKESLRIGERIRATIEKQEIHGRSLTISVGSASFPQDTDDKENLIKKADLALYKAKSEGKNRVVPA